MRVFLAGATGVIGVRLVPLLLAAGHEVAGLTRSQPEVVERLGAKPVVCDVYDRERLRREMRAFAPDLVLDELTDLPDDRAQLEAWLDRNARIRSEGTRNLLDAAGSARTVAQSIAFPPGAPEHERMVLGAGGVVLRYGVFYGPGTYNETPPEGVPRIHVDVAARRTVELLDAPAGSLFEIVE
ncbi:MAG TPA: NAD-dependent epimerase/dehydratase family protein [Gaiellaceae bacterium]|nr:NAD-dependent epimerase/dehydratase family protein [Gaiellaceae bacterium]